MKRIFTWFVLLNKRLYKKITFLCILLLIPLLVGTFQLVARQPSGVASVVLACYEPQDPLCRELVDSLKRDTRIISFQEDTPENAKILVSAGKADGAWIFPKDMKACLQAFVAGESGKRSFVQVIEREATVVMGLARERLSGVLFEEAVREVYLRSVREHAPMAADRSDEELLTYLHNANVTGQLFEFYDIYGNQKDEAGNYLTAPLRGLLAVVAAIGSAVTAMYYQKDKENGIFSLLPERYIVLGEFGYQMVSAWNIMAVVLFALVLSGLSVNIFLELALFVLYSICCSIFGMLLRLIFGGGKWLAVWLPVISLLMLVICPVFFDAAAMQKLQFAFPPTYYITGAYNYSYLTYCLCYTGGLFLLCGIIAAGKRLRRQ